MSLRKNFSYNCILTLSNYLFPLIVYPWVSRVLGVSNIGIYNFVDSTINYFSLISMLGITTIGIREIASNNGDSQKLSKTFSSLISLNFILTTIAIILLIIATSTIQQLQIHHDLFYIGILKLIGNFLLIDWFYKGIEDFRYITVRTIIIKCIYVISILLLVRNKNDVTIYYCLTCTTIFLNAITNIYHSKKLVSFKLSNIEINKYLYPVCIIGIYMLLTNMYTSFNTIFLGFTSSNEEVGFFSTSCKLFSIIIAFYTAWTNVAMPHISNMLAYKDKQDVNKFIRQSINTLLAFSIPSIIIGCIFSPDIISLLSGKGYDGAYLPTRILMPLLFIIGYEQILIIQILIPLRKDKILLINSIIGAILGIILNIILVPYLNAIGSCIAWITSELAVLICAQYFISKNINLSFPWKSTAKSITTYLPAACLCILIYTNVTAILRFFITIPFMFVYALTVEYYILKNELVIDSIKKLNTWIKNTL